MRFKLHLYLFYKHVSCYTYPMIRKYTQMREDSNMYPLDTYNELSKAQQRVFTYLMKHRDDINQQRMQNKEIADALEVHPQHISTDMKAIDTLDMIRRGKYNMIMINPHMWFAGDVLEHKRVVTLWEEMEQEEKHAVSK